MDWGKNMDYITVRQAAEKWSVTIRWVQALLKAERIPGAVQPARDWLIPRDAQKPADGRVNNRRHPKKEVFTPDKSTESEARK
jgi:hypothetical protein